MTSFETAAHKFLDTPSGLEEQSEIEHLMLQTPGLCLIASASALIRRRLMACMATVEIRKQVDSAPKSASSISIFANGDAAAMTKSLISLDALFDPNEVDLMNHDLFETLPATLDNLGALSIACSGIGDAEPDGADSSFPPLHFDHKAPMPYMTSNGTVRRPLVFSTGSLSLDIATECGGLPAARFVEIYGGESSGKTTLCLQAVAHAQRRGATCAFIDAEHALDPSYAQRIGVNMNDMPVIAPDTGEQAFQIIETLIVSGSVDIIVVDSAAALLPKSEAMNITTETSSAQALMIGNALKRLTPLVAKHGTLVIFTNQIRSHFDGIDGETEVTPCGHALKHYLSMRICVRANHTAPNKPLPGYEVLCTIVKNKLGPQFAEAAMHLNYGIVREADLARLGLEYEVLTKKQGQLYFGDYCLGSKPSEMRAALAEAPEIGDQIESAIRERAGVTGDLKIVV